MPLTRLPLTTGVSGTLAAGNGGTGVTSADEIGNLVKLASVSATGTASSISFDGYFTSDYDNYVVYYNNLYSSSSASTLYMRARQSNADLTSDYYFSMAYQSRQSTTNNWSTNQGGWNAGAARLTTDTLGDSTSEAGHARYVIFNPLGSSYKRIDGDLLYLRANQADLIKTFLQMEVRTTSALSGLTLYIDSGNIYGDLTLYGVKN